MNKFIVDLNSFYIITLTQIQIYRRSLWTVAPTNLSVCVCVSVSLSRFYGLYLACYESGFDQTW